MPRLTDSKKVQISRKELNAIRRRLPGFPFPFRRNRSAKRGIIPPNPASVKWFLTPNKPPK